MKNRKTMSMLALGIVALLGVGFVAAYQGDYSVKGSDYSEDRHEAMEEAFDNLDYDAWVALMAETGRHSRVMEVVNEGNFAVFVEAHEAGEVGNLERAAELRTELGLGNGQGSRNGSGFGGGQGMHKGSMQGAGMRR
ncbi:hypothetical protein K8R30_03925 [archaeon]|nr:hypothetical protein [archaeon]